MPSDERFVIVGAGLAGAKAAETLRAEGFDGEIVLLDLTGGLAYERPPLSKQFLLAKMDWPETLVHPLGWAEEHRVVNIGCAVSSIDPAAHEVTLEGVGPLSYSRLLLTMGAVPRVLDVPGADRRRLHYLRTIPDSVALRREIDQGDRRVVVIGAGWIGLEVAAAAREYGNEVTVVEPQPTPIHQAVGPELGEVFAGLHRDHGVTLLTGEGVREIDESGVVTSGGQRLAADVIVVGIGAAPNTRIAAEAGLAVDDGVLVDAALRTSAPDIWAAGDVAGVDHPFYGRRVRVEHWANALDGGPAAARSMLGQEVVYDKLPYFFSDQYDLGMEFSGLAEPGSYDEVVFRGDVGGREFVALWMSGDRIVAGMNVNVWDVTDDIQALIRAGKPVDRARLTDPSVPFAELL
jgi:3-phenylpropionate/trans-cinnamate dioxygenase ferredoxin reductase subunit